MKNYLIKEIQKALSSINQSDIYALSLYLEYANDNPYEPIIILGYNTVSNFNKVCKTVDILEAKWNYAYWLQNEIVVFGEDESRTIVKNWFIKNNLGYMTYEEFFSNDINEDLCNKIDDKIKNELIKVVKHLHCSGFINQKFNTEIPVIIHQLEYYNEIAEINKKANPNYLLKEFIEFFG